jgi:lactoylglutathione lyase
MTGKIALITILTDFVPGMVKFYQEALGFFIKVDMGEYVELENDGVRFAICDREIMLKATNHESYRIGASGQAFELAFPCDSPEEVDRAYSEVVARGGKPIHPPASMPWGQRTAFFADPEGYIHELFSELPK